MMRMLGFFSEAMVAVGRPRNCCVDVDGARFGAPGGTKREVREGEQGSKAVELAVKRRRVTLGVYL